MVFLMSRRLHLIFLFLETTNSFCLQNLKTRIRPDKTLGTRAKERSKAYSRTSPYDSLVSLLAANGNSAQADRVLYSDDREPVFHQESKVLHRGPLQRNLFCVHMAEVNRTCMIFSFKIK